MEFLSAAFVPMAAQVNQSCNKWQDLFSIKHIEYHFPTQRFENDLQRESSLDLNGALVPGFLEQKS